MSPESRQLSDCKVLIVDPDLGNSHDLAEALHQEGYATLQAATFAEGRRLWAEELPEALIAEIRLGQYNGLQLLVRAKLDRPDTATIITCALPDVVLEAETRRFGGIFLRKPLDFAQVVSVIRAHGQRQTIVRAQNPGDRRTSERRKILIAGFVPERRENDRRGGQYTDRRIVDRRQLTMPLPIQNRRINDRRARGRQDS